MNALVPFQASKPLAHISGAREGCKMLLLGEAWGESEDILKRPFVGESGKLLFEMLGEALPDLFPELHAQATKMFRYGLAWARAREPWLEACGIAMTNVLAFRPPDNKLESLCCDKKEASSDYPFAPASKGKYLRAQYFSELNRLREELTILRPNCVIALGNTASWAMLNATNIGSIRGAIAESPSGAAGFVKGANQKILPTYHPAAVLRQWNWRPIVVADLMKGWREAQFPELRRPARQLYLNPMLEELEVFIQYFRLNQSQFPFLSVDIETAGGQINCIGFAWRRDCALVIPLAHPTTFRPYWPDAGVELRVWEIIRELLESPVPKIGQNFLYDLQYILKLGIRPANVLEDTMLLHHSLYPEMQKGLGFLASIYCNEPAYKLMRRVRPDTEKRDE